MEGIVKSFVPEKRFGFIEGADGRSYFFHFSAFTDPPKEPATLDGALVIFDPWATPKGLAARRLTLVRNQAVAWEMPPEFLVLRDDTPKRGEIVAQVDAVTVSGSQSPDDLRVQIRRLAKAMGANALLGLHYSKSTGQSGNYQFTVHNFTARPAIVMLRRMTSDLAAVERSEQRSQALASALEDGHHEYRAHLDWLVAERRRKARKCRIAFIACLLGLGLLSASQILPWVGAMVVGVVMLLVFAVWPIEPKNPTWPRLVSLDTARGGEFVDH